MTETAPPPVPFGQALGEAFRGAHALQLRVLATAGSSFLEWVVMNLVAADSRPLAVDALTARLETEISAQPAEVEDVLSALADAGRVATIAANGNRAVELTPAGNGYHAEVRKAVNAASRELLGSFTAEQVATAVGVLVGVRERAPLVAPSG